MLFKVKSVDPFHDYVMVRRCDHTVSAGGLFVIQDSPSNLAEVIGVGPGREGVPGTKPLVKVGDKVILDKWIGTKVMVDGVECTLVKWYDCQAGVQLTEGEATDDGRTSDPTGSASRM